jgi:hypothetical protein
MQSSATLLETAMPQFKLIAAIVLVLGFSAFRASGAAKVLPPDVIASDTVAVIHVDAAHFNPDKLHATATAMLGDDAKEVDEPMRKFKEAFTKATAAGLDAMTMVMGAPKKDDPDDRRGSGILYLTLKPDADVKAIEAMITESLLERGDKREMVFDQVDNYLAMHRKKQEFPVKPDANREAAFAQALQSVADATIQVAFIPDAAGRAMMKKAADDAGDQPKDIRPLLAKSSWMTLAITLGSSPQVTGGVSAANETDAASLTEEIKLSLDDFKVQTAKPGPMVLVAPLITKVIDGIKIAQTGTHVTVRVNAGSLKLIADFADNMGWFNRGR